MQEGIKQMIEDLYVETSVMKFWRGQQKTEVRGEKARERKCLNEEEKKNTILPKQTKLSMKHISCADSVLPISENVLTDEARQIKPRVFMTLFHIDIHVCGVSMYLGRLIWYADQVASDSSKRYMVYGQYDEINRASYCLVNMQW